MANWAQGPLALGPGTLSVPDCKRSTGYLCLCILPMRRSPGKSQKKGQEGQGGFKQLDVSPSNSFISPKVLLAFLLALPCAPWNFSKLA